MVIEKIWWKKLFQRKHSMLAVTDKPRSQQSNLINSDTRTNKIFDELDRIPTKTAIANSTSEMTKSEVISVGEATCSSSSANSHESSTDVNSSDETAMADSTGTTNDRTTEPPTNEPVSPGSAQQSPDRATADPTTATTQTSGQSAAAPISSSTRPAKRSAIDFRFGKLIGEGSFSTVYIAQDIHTKREVAIKVCEKQLIVREKKEEYVIREREVMQRLSDVPGFVSLICAFQDNKCLYYVMTLARNGDLLPYINKVGSFDFACTQFYAAELLLAIEHMHRKGIVHRDLKPENILLDENMHTVIADFGSSRILDDRGGENDSRRRANSFVGTAQYVSPEILKGERLTKAADLWALGCIIYQMISGLPPFRAGSEYLIFQKILDRDLHFPEGFNKMAKDLVQRLIQIDPHKRLGAKDQTDLYDSIRAHEFFDGIIWETIRTQTPPPIHPYLPGLDDDANQYKVPEHIEPGLGDEQLRRLLELELGTSTSTTPKPKPAPQPKETEPVTATVQKEEVSKWQQFVEGEVILKQGLVNKRKGLFARKRMLLLTTGPRLFYIDPDKMVKKGEIPMSADVRCETKNFKIFFVHTPNRTFYLEDPEGYAMCWVKAIDDLRQKSYENRS